MHLTGLDLLFWAAGFIAHLALLGVLLIRRRFQTFPVFTAFIVANILRTVVLYFVEFHGSAATYFYTFWSLGILDSALQLAVFYEMYSHTFRPLGAWARDVRGMFPWLVAVTIAVAVGLTWMAAPHARRWMQVVVIKGNFFSSVCMSELFVGMIALSVRTGLPWKTHVARISQGLGVYSMIEVLIETAHSYFGVARNTHSYTLLSHFRMGAYLCCASYWIVMLWKNAQKPRKLPAALSAQMLRLQGFADTDLKEIRVRHR